MERIKELYYHHADQVMAWYDGLNELYQYGVLFGLLFIGLGIFAFIILHRVTR